jgi:CheY-like chemotaxis protein
MTDEPLAAAARRLAPLACNSVQKCVALPLLIRFTDRMAFDDKRTILDRRHVPRGGRRPKDRPGKHPSILVADSYDGVRKSCARYLDRFHFQVFEAADGEQALTQISSEPPQVVLAELNLPYMPARRLANWLAQSWRTRQIPVIVLSSDFDAADSPVPPDFRNLVAGVLVKPFSLRAMLDEIRRVIRRSETH